MELVMKLDGHSDRVWCVSFHNAGNLIASCSSDKTLKIWDPNNGQLKTTLSGGHQRSIRQVSWSPNSAKL